MKRRRAKKNPLGLTSTEYLVALGGVGLLGLGAVLYFTSKPGNTTPATGTQTPTADGASLTGSTT